jgi:D-sedoheptulose 7-phosphate isomerase
MENPKGDGVLMKRRVLEIIDESIQVKGDVRACANQIVTVAKEAVATLKQGGKLVIFGNGGSAADAQHITAELVCKFKFKRNSLPAIALTTNPSVVTAIANDMEFSQVFARQIEALATSKDLVVGISTSGRSLNVIKGIEAAKKKGAKTVALTGKNGGRLAQIADVAITVPSADTPRIQECHIMIGHILCELIEAEIFGEIKQGGVS